MHLHVGHQHWQFWPILVRFVQYYSMFWGPRAISTIDDPGVRLLFHRNQSQFWLILTRFMDYYSPFWGPEVIFIVVEPQGALTCRLSTLAVLADSGLFRGLLLTDLGSRSDSHSCRTPRCAYVSVINTRSFDQFRPVSWTITHRFGVLQRFP